MGEGRMHRDQRLPWPGAASDQNGATGDLLSKVLWALFALLLMAGVAVFSYLSGRASLKEPLESGGETVPLAQPAPATLPQLAPPPSDLAAAPPVARMLEAEAEAEAEAKTRTATAVAEQQVTEQPVIPITKARQPPRAREFRPPHRVLAARRAIARRAPGQQRRILYASRVVELGNYRNRGQAQAAHARLVRVYPYVKTLPRTIMSFGAPTGKARAFHLRLTTGSPEHARLLCQNLHSIGRGCAVLPEPLASAR